MPTYSGIPTLRIVWDNKADTATVTSSTAVASTLPLANLRTNIRSQVCRVLGASTTFELTWGQAQQIGCVAFASCNLSSDSVIHVEGYQGATLKVDITKNFIPGTILGNWDFTQNLNVNNFHDNAATGCVWFEHQWFLQHQQNHKDSLWAYGTWLCSVLRCGSKDKI